MIDLFFRDAGGHLKKFDPLRIVDWWAADKAILIRRGLWYGSFIGAQLRHATMLEF